MVKASSSASSFELMSLLKASFQRPLEAEEIQYIQKLSASFPYFILPHFLIAKDSKLDTEIFRAAVYAPNRKTLRDFIQGKLYFAEIERHSDMQAQADQRAYTALFPPFPYDPFSIVVDLGQPEVKSLDSLMFSMGPLPQQPMPYPFLETGITIRVAKYQGLFQKLRDQLEAFGQKERIHVQRTIQADQLVDKFLENLPQFSKPRHPAMATPTVEHEAAKASVEEGELISETLALLHLRQGNTQEAIRIYKALGLRFPEKKAYFEIQLKKINDQ